MRQLPHYPPHIPNEPLLLRRIFRPSNSAPREDELVPFERRSKTVTMESADAFLREDLKRSGAHGVRIETEDGEIHPRAHCLACDARTARHRTRVAHRRTGARPKIVA